MRRVRLSLAVVVVVYATMTGCSSSGVGLSPIKPATSPSPASSGSPSPAPSASAVVSPTAAASPSSSPAASPTPIKTATPTPAPPTPPPTPTPVPSTVSVALAPAIPSMTASDDGKQNPVVMISIGGSSPFPVSLDTGSSGVRVYADAFAKFGGTPSPGTTADSYGLGGDRTLYGTVGTNDVKFTGVNGTDTLDFGSIDYEYVTAICANGTTPTMGCKSEVAKYEALGLYGTFGIRPVARGDSSGLVYTPIGALPGNLGKGFIVSLGNGTAERLILGLTPANSAGFNTYDIGSTLTNGRYLFNSFATVPFCYSIASADGTTSYTSPCGSLTFLSDTGGNPGLQFPGAPTGPESLVDASGNLVAGTTVTVSLGGTTWWSFTAGGCTDYSKFGVDFNTAAGSENNGVVPFFYEDVLYDLVDGIFGYRNNNLPTPPFCSGMQM